MKPPADFDDFQEKLKAVRESHPLLWELRDAIYLALHHADSNEITPLRHRFGLALWRARWWREWLLAKERSDSAPNEPARFGFLFYGWWDSHYSTLLPVLLELAAAEPVTVWHLALTPQQTEELRVLPNVRLFQLPDPSNYGRPQPSDLGRAMSECRALTRMITWPPDERALLRGKLRA